MNFVFILRYSLDFRLYIYGCVKRRKWVNVVKVDFVFIGLASSRISVKAFLLQSHGCYEDIITLTENCLVLSAVRYFDPYHQRNTISFLLAVCSEHTMFHSKTDLNFRLWSGTYL